MAAKKKTAAKKPLKYGEIVEELERILNGIEEGRVDIDDLSAEVERAVELIKTCRERINATQIRVRKVVAALEEEEESFGTDEEDLADGGNAG